MPDPIANRAFGGAGVGPPIRIPFNKPYFAGNEVRYISETVAAGHISGDGQFTAACQELLTKLIGVHKTLLTTSCTHALDMSAMLLNLQPGDEVIVPSFTFVSTANAFVLRGARPVFADIRPDTLNIDEAQLEDLMTPRTRAVYLVHYAGVGCEMDAIGELAQRRGIPVIEDNAHGLLGTYRGRPLGSFGAMSTLSFHETKNFTCGEGGALQICWPEFADRAEVIREKGTNRSRFFRGQVDKYSWVDVGSSYLPSDLLAAYLYAQLELRDRIQARRAAIWERYYAGIQNWASREGVGLPVVPKHCNQPFHMFYMLLPSLEARCRLIQILRDQGILAVFHYLPLHLSKMGLELGGREGDAPVTEDISDRLLRLPFYNDLDDLSIDEVIEAVSAFRC